LEEVDLEDLSQLGRIVVDVVEEPNISLVQEGAETHGRFEEKMGFHMDFKMLLDILLTILLNIFVLVTDLVVMLVARIWMKQLHIH
jgi:hypothetical protein